MCGQFITDANRFLAESTYYHKNTNHVPSANEVIGQTFSKRVLDEDFKYVTTVKVDTQDIFIHISDSIYRPNKITVIAVVLNEDSRYSPVGFLFLSKASVIKVKALTNYVQVNLVHVIEDYRKSQIAFNMYLAVISIGYNLISDDEQYEGAHRLWKALALVAPKLNLKVKVWDNINYKMIGDYDGSNIPDTTIWNKDEFSYGIILVLQKN